MKKFWKLFLDRMVIVLLIAMFMGISAGNIFMNDFGYDIRRTVIYIIGLVPVLYGVYTFGRYIEWKERKERDK